MRDIQLCDLPAMIATRLRDVKLNSQIVYNRAKVFVMDKNSIKRQTRVRFDDVTT